MANTADMGYGIKGLAARSAISVFIKEKKCLLYA
jgi:hypothetical protein